MFASGYPRQKTNKQNHTLQTNQISSTNKATGAYNNEDQSLKLRNIASIYNNEDEASNQSWGRNLNIKYEDEASK